MDNKSEISTTEFLIGDCKELLSTIANAKKVQHVLKLFSIHHIYDLPCYQKVKNKQSFRKYYTKANHISQFRGSRDLLLEANKLYTKSIAFASNSQELAEAYVQKSSLLLRMDKIQDCLQAVNCYLKLEHAHQWKLSMVLRKAECLVKLRLKEAKQFQKEALKWIEQLPVPDQDVPTKKLNKIYKTLQESVERQPKPLICSVDQLPFEFNYTHLNEKIPSVGDFMRLKCNDQFGRHYVAGKDIRPGTCLAKVAPYVQVLSIAKRFLYCWGCLKFIWNCVPCLNCCVVVFCTKECRAKSWQTFHNLECDILPQRLGMSDVHCDLHIVMLRMIILAVKEFGSVEKLRQQIEIAEKTRSDPCIKGFIFNGQFKSDSYLNVLTLQDDVKNPSSMKHWLVHLIYFLQILANRSSFFGTKMNESWYQLSNNEDVLFIGGLLLKNLFVCNLNGFDIVVTSEKGTQTIGMDVVPNLSFLNHSCSPNADIVFKNGYRLLFSIDSIKKTEQIYIRYTRFDAEKLSRQVYLRDRYLFDCKCVACKNNWPRFHSYPLYQNIANTSARTDLMKLKYFKVEKMFNNLLSQGVSDSKNLFKMMDQLRKALEFSNQSSSPCMERENTKCIWALLYDKFIV